MLDFLHLHALWLIMDPWLPHPWPKDRQRWPHIDQHNQKTIDDIVDYLPNLRHVTVSVSPAYSVHPTLQHLPNTENRFARLDTMMQALQLTDIVYIGFHWGHCLLRKPDGAINVSKRTQYKLYAYPRLCSILPHSNDEILTKKMSNYVMLLKNYRDPVDHD